ncbi:MAG: cell division protein ZapA [Hyphomicrobiaceae bacterium]|nr:cell division protein ZapA [Hyphomicrobiaceae bacterium]
MPQVSVSIGGKAFRMACDEGEEARLTALAQRFDAAFGELHGAFGEIGDARLAVMAGILMTDRLTEAEARIAALEARLEGADRDMAGRADRQSAQEERVAEALETAARRIEALGEKLAAPLRAKGAGGAGEEG